MKNRVCIILVTRNRLAYLRNVVESLTKQSISFVKCIIVDNDSTDGTIEYLANIDRNYFDVILSNINIGHGAGLKKGMQHATFNFAFDYFLFLEDDSLIDVYLVEEILNKINANTDFDAICSEGRNYKIGTSISVIPDTFVKQVDFGVFDAFILKMDIVKKIGFPKDDYFMMCDDLEYCKRIKRNGYKIGLVKILNHKTLHFGSEKFSKTTLWRGYYQSRNRIHVLREYLTFKEFIDCFIWQFKYLYSAFLSPDWTKRFYFRLMGIWHGIRGILGKTLDPSNFSFTRQKF